MQEKYTDNYLRSVLTGDNLMAHERLMKREENLANESLFLRVVYHIKYFYDDHMISFLVLFFIILPFVGILVFGYVNSNKAENKAKYLAKQKFQEDMTRFIENAVETSNKYRISVYKNIITFLENEDKTDDIK